MLVQDKIVVVAEEKQLRRAASLPVSDNVAGLPAWRRYFLDDVRHGDDSIWLGFVWIH
jgi:hypothetical protein